MMPPKSEANRYAANKPAVLHPADRDSRKITFLGGKPVHRFSYAATEIFVSSDSSEFYIRAAFAAVGQLTVHDAHDALRI